MRVSPSEPAASAIAFQPPLTGPSTGPAVGLRLELNCQRSAQPGPLQSTRARLSLPTARPVACQVKGASSVTNALVPCPWVVRLTGCTTPGLTGKSVDPVYPVT